MSIPALILAPQVKTALDIILQETGKVFAGVLEDAGVYKNTPEGKAAFQKFVDYVNQEA